MSEGQRESCLRLLLLLVRGGRHVPEAHVAHVAHELPAHDSRHWRLQQHQLPCAPEEKTDEHTARPPPLAPPAAPSPLRTQGQNR